MTTLELLDKTKTTFYFTRYNQVVVGQTIAVDAETQDKAEALARIGEYREVGDEFTSRVIGDADIEPEAE